MEMSQQKREARLEEIRHQFKVITIQDTLPMIAIGLGLFGKFGENPESLHPMLANESLVNTMFLIAVPITLFNAYRFYKLSVERAKLQNNEPA